MNKRETFISLAGILGIVIVLALVVVVNVLGGWLVETLWNALLAPRGVGAIDWFVGWIVFCILWAVFIRKPMIDIKVNS